MPGFINILFFFLVLFASLPVLANESIAQGPQIRGRDPAFATPAGLRPRVNFWIDIFTKYGKHHAVIHHREFPQAVFEVLDFNSHTASMNPVQLEVYRKKKVQERIDSIKQSFRHLASGAPARTAMERHIVAQMAFLPGGAKKYNQVLQEDLVRSQTGIREKYIESVERSGRYMHILEHIFINEFKLPVELTRLPFIESSFDYKAYSSVGAAGIWQFMPRTAKSYMRVDHLIDERRDVVSATRGAAKYLTQAYRTLQTWPLALTSYNHGVGGVSKRVREAGTTDLVRIVENPNRRYFGFASGNFYPEFLAALEVYEQLPRYFPGVRPEAPLWIASRKLSHPCSVRHLMHHTGVGIGDLKRMNYAVAETIWSGRASLPVGYEIKVPKQAASRLHAMPLPDPGARSEATFTKSTGASAGSYIVRRGDTLGGIAQRHRMTVQQLKTLNGLRSNDILIGQRLRISGAVTQNATTPRASSEKAAPGHNVVRHHVVQSGESLWGISRKYGVSVEQIQRLNGLRGNTLRIGQKLRVS